MQFRSVAAFVIVACEFFSCFFSHHTEVTDTLPFSVVAATQASPVPVANAETVAVPETAPVVDDASPVVERGCRFWCW